MKRERLIAPMFAILLITSGIGSIATQNAMAVHQCDSKDMLVYGFTFSMVNGERCGDSHYDDAIKEMQESDASQEQVDIYNGGAAVKGNDEVTNSIFNNYINDTRSVAWSKAEKAIAEAYKSGKTKSEAKVAAKEAIASYYTVKQINLIEQYNMTIKEIEYLHSQAEMEDGISSQFVDIMIQDAGHLEGATDTDYLVETVTENVVLINGTEKEALGYKVELDINGGWSTAYRGNATFYPHDVYEDNYDQWGNQALKGGDYPINSSWSFAVRPPNSNYENLSVMKPSKFYNRWNRIETLNSELQSESDTFVESIWTDIQSGAISADDIISRTTLMFEYGTNAQNGSYHDMLGATASMGLDTPNLTNTGTMVITYNGSQHEGMLFGEPPNSTWEVGTTYNTLNFDSPVLFATTEGELLELSGSFTLDKATTKDGTEQSTVTTTEYNYQTANTEEMQQLMEDMEELRQEIENREPDPSAGTGGSDGSSSPNLPSWLTEKYAGIPLWGIFVGVLAIGMLLTNRGN